MKKSKTTAKLLTDVELELMNILWRLGEGTVSDVLDRLPPDRKLAYTSVSTILRILEQKGALKTRKEGRGHVYIPATAKAEYENKTVEHVVEKVFDGTRLALVKHLLAKTSSQELEEIKKLIAETSGSKK